MKLHSSFRSALLGLALCAGRLCSPAWAQGLDEPLPALFDPPADAAGPIARQTSVSARPRVRRLSVDFSQLRSLGGLNQRLRLPLFAGRDYVANFAGQISGATSSAWQGTLEGLPNSWVTATHTDNALLLRVYDGKGSVITVSPQADGSHVAAEVPGGLQGTCGTPDPAPGQLVPEAQRPRRAGLPRRHSVDGKTWVDVLVLFTTRSAKLPGAMSTKALDLINSANWVHDRSGTGLRFRLVGAEEIAYDDTGENLGVHLNRLGNSSDGFMDSAIARRDALGADLVALLPLGRANSGTTLGIANLSGWASVVEVTQDPLTFVHELAHNLGCTHEVGAPGVPGDGFNHGFSHTETWDVLIGTIDERRVTVMYSGFNNGTRTDFFSSPDLQFEFTGGDECGFLCPNVNRPLGVANAADNVRYIRENGLLTAVSKVPLFYLNPGWDASASQATVFAPEPRVAAIFDEWIPATGVAGAESPTLRFLAGNYPQAPARLAHKARLEKWAGAGSARISR